MLKKIWNLLKPTMYQWSTLNSNLGKPLLIIFSTQCATETVPRIYELWLGPKWDKEVLLNKTETKLGPLQGWILKTEIILINTEI